MSDTLSLGFVSSNRPKQSSFGSMGVSRVNTQKRANILKNLNVSGEEARETAREVPPPQVPKETRMSRMKRPVRAPPTGSSSGSGSGSTPREDHLLSQRTEYLEQMNRKTKSMLDDVTAKLNDVQEDSESKNVNITNDVESLFNMTNVIFGKTSHPVPALVSEDSNADINIVLKSKPFSDTIPTGQWLCLVYPMQRVDSSKGHKVIMKSKMVDSTTGQLYWAWITLSEELDGEVTKYFSEFSAFPKH